MFKLIGGVVVCGFALYGLATYLKRPVVKVVIDPGMLRTQKEATRSSGAGNSANSAEETGPEVVPDNQVVPAAN